MANFQGRLSTYSTLSNSTPRPGHHAPSQVSTTTLLNALHTSYKSRQPYPLESSTSLVVNSWATASEIDPDGRIGGTVDLEIGRRAWEHARRRAEDGCIILGSLHESTPSLFAPSISGMPLSLPTSFYHALDVLKAFTHCVTPLNPSYPRHSALSATFSMNLAGAVRGVRISLSTSGIDTAQGLTNVPADAGFRAFNVFYYLNSSSASATEREILSLRHVSEYALLKKSGTYLPPGYLPTADDEAAAEDFRANLRAIGIRGRDLSNLLACLTAILKLGDTLGYDVDGEIVQDVCEDVAGLLDVDPETLLTKCDQLDRSVLIGGIYEALVDWVISRANDTMRSELIGMKANTPEGSDVGPEGIITPGSSEDDGDTVSITVIEIPSPALGRALALQNVFDDNEGINREMKEDGVHFDAAGSSVLDELRSAVAEREPELGIVAGPMGRQKEQERERLEAVLEKFTYELDSDNFLRPILFPVDGHGIQLGRVGRFDLMSTVNSSRVWFQLAAHATDAGPETLAGSINPWSAGAVSRQLRTWRLPEWANRRNKQLDFTADFDFDEFVQRYSRLGCSDGREGVQSFCLGRGWSNGEVFLGRERIWMREDAWWNAETMLDLKPFEETGSIMMSVPGVGAAGLGSAYSAQSPGLGSGFFGPTAVEGSVQGGSRDNLLHRQHSSATMGARSAFGAQSVAPTAAPTTRAAVIGDYGLGSKGDDHRGDITYEGIFDPETGMNKVVVEQPITATRRIWVAIVWALTFWIPSPLLRVVGRMKRPDVRMAWREKVVLVFIIFILNAIIIFMIVGFGQLLCPSRDKVWSREEVATHRGDDDFWVSHHGKVYDVSKFWRRDHSQIPGLIANRDTMQPFAGYDLDPYVVPPLTLACPNLKPAERLTLTSNNTDLPNREGVHVSGKASPYHTTVLGDERWYETNFLTTMNDFFKGDLVIDADRVKSEGVQQDHRWVFIEGKVYDFTDYFVTIKDKEAVEGYAFLDSKLTDIVRNNAGTDITELFQNALGKNSAAYNANYQCVKNLFYVGKKDFRKTPRCMASTWILLAFAIILCVVIVVKFLAALQLGSKRRPGPQDKFVICQVPAYTEGEDQLRKGLDSLTALAYDNKRKLICVICDGMIVGGGNDRPTPKIVLDILGVDPKVDPPALPFKSVGTGSEQLNYGKVYSGLYEYEGNVVPYIVVVKVGKESEQVKSKPGNRGKRDSQILLMSFLNRVHHRAPMSPLELEMFHQINNVIGVDPELYEYLLMVDADTMVKEDSLTRLVASCANDAKIAGICGETSLENEERSWWTMIQVYEYYISHHLAKAFESLFGSVTCLPGCFCMYRLRTADKGRPLIISDKVIAEYSDCEVDTLHKKNLLSLGEDRYLTTLMTKHFPNMSFKFVPDAYAQTAAPETFSILLSQRRRWINSTVHNLAELMFLKDMCGFCCFSMRFVVFIDLFGTIILPATCGYLAYLIYVIASKTGPFPTIAIAMLAAVYGLQAVIFIIKRQWQHVGWMIIYILAFPIYSFVLPVYSFWKQDDFSWGNTRVVIGEKGNKVVAIEDEGFDPRSIPLQRWDDYAASNNLPGRRGLVGNEKMQNAYDDDGYEMNDMQSVYSSVQPASTILTGFPAQRPPHMPPASPGPYAGMQQRGSNYSHFSRYTDHPQDGRTTSMGNLTNVYEQATSPYSQRPSMAGFQSSDNLMAPSPHSPSLPRGKSPLGFASRPASTVNFQSMMSGPSDSQVVEAIQACLREVDLDTVTKKQLKALTEQRLQTQLSGDRRIFLDQAIDQELANM